MTDTDLWRRASAELLGNVDPAKILSPGDQGFPDATHLWNGAIDPRRALAVRCATVSDVQFAVRANR